MLGVRPTRELSTAIFAVHRSGLQSQPNGRLPSWPGKARSRPDLRVSGWHLGRGITDPDHPVTFVAGHRLRRPAAARPRRPIVDTRYQRPRPTKAGLILTRLSASVRMVPLTALPVGFADQPGKLSLSEVTRPSTLPCLRQCASCSTSVLRCVAGGNDHETPIWASNCRHSSAHRAQVVRQTLMWSRPSASAAAAFPHVTPQAWHAVRHACRSATTRSTRPALSRARIRAVATQTSAQSRLDRTLASSSSDRGSAMQASAHAEHVCAQAVQASMQASS